jgi:hypothetical protein
LASVIDNVFHSFNLAPLHGVVMTNLNTAKQALKGELAHAQHGLAYYTSRMEALQQALEQLDRAEGELPSGKKASAKTSAIAHKQNGAKGGRKSRVAARANGGSALPSTAGNFWSSLISARQISAPEILEAAVAKLGLTPTPEQRKKLSNRMVGALNQLVQSQAISDTGSGRARRYFIVSH